MWNADLVRRVQLKATGADIHKVNGALSYYRNLHIFDNSLDLTTYYEDSERYMRIYLIDGDANKFWESMRDMIREVATQKLKVLRQHETL